MNNSNTRHDAVAVSSLYLGCADMWLWGGLLGSQFSKLSEKKEIFTTQNLNVIFRLTCSQPRV